jgi:membrane protease YdiL (CAAX protease family)
VEVYRDAPAGAEPDRKRSLLEALGATVLVTAGVTAASALLPDRYIATAVAFVFLAATWALVWRKNDEAVRRAGLAFGGLVIPGALDARAIARAAAPAIGLALLFALVTFAPFWIGWRWWWHAHGHFHATWKPLDALNEVFGQIVIIALPEEAFYRGYLQSRLDDVWAPRLRVLGAQVGPGLLVASALFAVGHVATIHEPARLAVFFPSLLFGWMRARTGGVGAGVLFHALCNLFSETLGRGYGIY